MKKNQKIIELMTAAKAKVAEIETKIAFARSEAAGNRARLMWDRAAELNGLEADGTERFDVLAKYRAKLAGVNEKLEAAVAQFKAEIHQVKAECKKQCAAAEDDPEPEEDNDATVQGLQPQQTVYCDGSEHSARIVARRLLNKLPHIPEGGSISAMICRGKGDLRDHYWLNADATNGTLSDDCVISKLFDENNHNADSEAEFVGRVRALFESRKEGCSSHVAEPLSRALDAVFGGNPVEEFNNLVSDTVKARKEGCDE